MLLFLITFITFLFRMPVEVMKIGLHRILILPRKFQNSSQASDVYYFPVKASNITGARMLLIDLQNWVIFFCSFYIFFW